MSWSLRPDGNHSRDDGIKRITAHKRCLCRHLCFIHTWIPPWAQPSWAAPEPHAQEPKLFRPRRKIITAWHPFNIGWKVSIKVAGPVHRAFLLFTLSKNGKWRWIQMPNQSYYHFNKDRIQNWTFKTIDRDGFQHATEIWRWQKIWFHVVR